jgi:hypothetical protein
MDFKKLADKAKDAIDKRGGVDSLKADADELKKVAKGKGSLTDKAKAAAAALKDPGERGRDEHRPGDAHEHGDAHQHKQQPEGEMHPAKDLGDPDDTPRKGGPPHA